MKQKQRKRQLNEMLQQEEEDMLSSTKRPVKKQKKKSAKKQERDDLSKEKVRQLVGILKEKTTRQRKKMTKKYCYMTNDELVNLCDPLDRPRARRVVDSLRNYLTNVSESKGFDTSGYPGDFPGVTDIHPFTYSEYNELLASNTKILAMFGIADYNFHNKETEFEVVDVEQVNMYFDSYNRTYYVTFRARDVKKAANGQEDNLMADLKTFQAIVVADWVNGGIIRDIVFCRPKA